MAAVDAAIGKDRLRLLEIAYYIAGTVTIFFVSFLLIHFSIFLFMGLNPQFFDHAVGANDHQATPPPPPAFFLVGANVIGLIILLGWTFGGLQIYAGRCLKHRRNSLLILIVASVECLFIPWGTFLGVSTFMIMQRPGVHSLFST